MNFTSFIEILVAIVVAYFLLKFIVSPVIKIVVGIIIIFVFIYLLQRFFGFNLNNVLSPFGITVDLNKWQMNFGWLLSPLNYIANQADNFLNFIWQNITKSIKT